MLATENASDNRRWLVYRTLTTFAMHHDQTFLKTCNIWLMFGFVSNPLYTWMHARLLLNAVYTVQLSRACKTYELNNVKSGALK